MLSDLLIEKGQYEYMYKNKANNMKNDIFDNRNNINYTCFRRMTSDKATDSRVDKHPKRKVMNQIIYRF